MSVASNVVAKFGGPGAVAKAIGKGPSTVSYWLKTGSIPSKWQGKLLDLAKEKSISLYPDDFIADPSDGAELTEEPTAELPVATHWGELTIGNSVIPCYVLKNGQRVFSLKGIMVGLIGIE